MSPEPKARRSSVRQAVARPQTEPVEPELQRLRRRCQRAERASVARAAFLAVMSHEIREPMNGVVGMARLLKDTPLDAEQRLYLDSVLESAETLLTIVNDILDLSRIDPAGWSWRRSTSTSPPSSTACGCRSSRVPVSAGWSSAARSCPGRLGWTGRSRSPAPGAPEPDRQCAEIHPSGACGGAGGPSCRRPGRSGLAIEVEDTGPGIPPAARRRLFSAFAQGDADTPRLFGGSGLGLTIAKRLTHALGGRMEVASQLGQGTSFRLELALEPAQGTARRWPRSQGRACWWSTRSRALRENGRDRGRLGARGFAGPVRPPSPGTAGRGRGPGLAVRRRAGRPQPRRSWPEELAAVVRGDPRLRHARLALLVASGIRGDAARAGRRDSRPICASRWRPRHCSTACARCAPAPRSGRRVDHGPQPQGAPASRACACSSPTTTQ